jgi:hypothetical protein
VGGGLETIGDERENPGDEVGNWVEKEDAEVALDAVAVEEEVFGGRIPT